jgi:hypothetical protein
MEDLNRDASSKTRRAARELATPLWNELKIECKEGNMV